MSDNYEKIKNNIKESSNIIQNKDLINDKLFSNNDQNEEKEEIDNPLSHEYQKKNNDSNNINNSTLVNESKFGNIIIDHNNTNNINIKNKLNDFNNKSNYNNNDKGEKKENDNINNLSQSNREIYTINTNRNKIEDYNTPEINKSNNKIQENSSKKIEINLAHKNDSFESNVNNSNLIENSDNRISQKNDSRIDRLQSKNMITPNNLNNKDNYIDKYPLIKYNQVSRTGLENIDDISYLNAVLQSLGQINDFANYFLRKDIQEEIGLNIKNKSLAFVTGRLFIHLYPYPSKPEIEIYSLKSYLKILKSLNIFYNNNKRRDVNKVLIFILNTLHNELSDKNNESIISETVTFSLRNELNCCNCRYPSCRRMSFNTFDLDISKTYQYLKKDINIYDCLNYWKSNNCPELYCYNCRNFTQRNKISIIESSPKVFIFLLERGINFDQYNNNIFIPFKVEETIDLSNFIQGGASNLYDITGIVSILLEEQKYISFCKSPIDLMWYCYNDKEISCISLCEIINYSYNQKIIPCILYYTKIGN
jgi:ubiquitin C-terminal hydrolase